MPLNWLAQEKVITKEQEQARRSATTIVREFEEAATKILTKQVWETLD